MGQETRCVDTEAISEVSCTHAAPNGPGRGWDGRPPPPPADPGISKGATPSGGPNIFSFDKFDKSWQS